jgi:hypothetical protein
MKLWLKQQITKAHHPSSHPISMSFCGAQRAGFSEHQFVEPCEDPSFLAYCMLNPHPSKNDEDQDGDDATGLKKNRSNTHSELLVTMVTNNAKNHPPETCFHAFGIQNYSPEKI